MKACVRCGESKDEAAFTVNRATEDGLNIYCRECLSAYRNARAARLNANRPEDWKKKTADKLAYQRKWHAAHPGLGTRYHERWLKKNLWRRRIKERVRYAVKTGYLKKWPCFVCGEPQVDGHHPDYSQPLAVVWLCKAHHREVHAMVEQS